MRVLLDIRRDGDGRVTGSVTPPAGTPVRFCGWLELIHVIEDHADTDPQEGTRT
ncbi:MAG TPA: hypothetical protein VFP06_08100 [Acidimicrobiales bacterium]|nr:hypothetical protein [Acidimicrobiales bacterium]